MSKSVSNDALWEKLSVISERLDSLSTGQKSQASSGEQVENNTHDFSGIKDEIIAEIGKQASLLGNHSDINFGANEQNVKVIDENIRKVWNIVSRIRKQQRETVESQKEFAESQNKPTEPQNESVDPPNVDREQYFTFRFFKIRKTTFLITILALLVFILTLFCMKQQNDYSLLNDKYYKQSAVIREMQVEVDSLKGIRISMEKKK